jgi:hypothetical protein
MLDGAGASAEGEREDLHARIHELDLEGVVGVTDRDCRIN